MEGLEVVIVAGIVAVFGGFVAVAWWNSPIQVAKRKLRSVQAEPIGGLRPGSRAKITGRVVLDVRLTSPLHGLACAYWHVRVDEKAGKNSWRNRADEWEAAPFWIEDPTGRVWVDPGPLKLALDTAHAGSSGAFNEPTEAEMAALERFGVEPTGVFGFNRTLRYNEASIHEGEQVTVYGEVALREIGGEVALALVPPADEDLVVSDASNV